MWKVESRAVRRQRQAWRRRLRLRRRGRTVVVRLVGRSAVDELVRLWYRVIQMNGLWHASNAELFGLWGGVHSAGGCEPPIRTIARH